MITINGTKYASSATHTGEPWRGWPVARTLQPYRPKPANDNKPERFRGGYPALSWLAEQDPDAVVAIASIMGDFRPVYRNKDDRDDDLGSNDERIRIHPDIDDLVEAANDARAVVPKGRLAARTGALRSGFPAAEKQYRVGGTRYRLGCAVFNVDSSETQQGLLSYWLDKNGVVQIPREQSSQRKGSRVPICWQVERYMRSWNERPRNDRDAAMEALYDSECLAFHLRRRGTPMPAQVYPPVGHSRVDIPEEKATLRAWLAEQMAGHAVTRCPDDVAQSTTWFGRVGGNKKGLSVPEIWREAEAAPDLPDDVLLTIETMLARGDLTDVAEAHKVDTTRPDRAGKRLVRAAGKAALALMPVNDNKKSKKAAA
ncbi:MULTISPECIES: hypothetical protein [unclassified Shinella]|uniref:hypothetical protein n=1 Tax=unclassified Shinella TaxID=2643062 RepID=UPI00225D50A7|nr:MULTISPECIES: hypothetical protein [unclassified Shinella]MCO5138319.1 hypothetical protein [Shinella sp.]MDC7255156.1 hypothetical protein [Shinella sp. YE25]CAI0337918.1 conserved hypothetical protein [Rhizobiaceae bacterium]CAK7256385.1 conserved protein of unknown function [Shinella sp. WSC3-e]